MTPTAAKNKTAAESRREERRRQQQELSRAQLLDAAEELFGSKGYHETTLKEIAEIAEYSVGSVYTFFESKDDIFNQVFIRRSEEFVPGEEAVLAEPGTPTEQLRRLVEYEVSFFRARPNFLRVFLRYGRPTVPQAATNELMAKRSKQTGGLHASLIKRGQDAGEFCDGDPVLLAELFTAIILSYEANESGNGERRLPLNELQDLVVRALSRP